MSSRQLEEVEENKLVFRLATKLGITVKEMNELEYDFDTLETNSGHITAQLLKFNDNSPHHILRKIKDLEENNTVYLDPWFFDDEEDYEINEITDMEFKAIKLSLKI